MAGTQIVDDKVQVVNGAVGISTRVIDDVVDRNSQGSARAEQLTSTLVWSNGKVRYTPDLHPYARVAATDILPLDEVVGLIGQGNMGMVYRAHHTRYGEVALKVPVVQPNNGLGSDGVIADFLRGESKAALDLSGLRGVPRVYAAGEKGGIPYLLMEYVTGTTLEDAMPNMLTEQKVDAMSQLAGIVSGIHSKGYLHRDIKPANIMVSKDNQVVLMDLGIAKKKGDGSTKRVTGTPFYMAPEQMRGEEDERADIYSFAATFYHVFSGKVPYSGNSTTEIMLNQVSRNYALLSQLVPELNPGIASLIDQCLRYNPADRPQSMAEVQERIADALNPGIVGKVMRFVPPSLARMVGYAPAAAYQTSRQLAA